MNELEFKRDIRSGEPTETAHRLARFREGWRKAAGGESYSQVTLEELTWDNLGYRMGRLFSHTSPELVEEMYGWCVRQQAESGEPPSV